MTDIINRPEQAAELRRRAEEIAQSSESPETLSPEETRKMLHELRVHQIELEMQNEELRRSQMKLDAARARYFDLYDLAPVGYCTLSEKGLILEANLTAASLLSVARGTMVMRSFASFILPEDQKIHYLHRKQLFDTGQPATFELRMVHRDGTSFWAHLMATAAQDAEGAPVCRIVISDISERKRVEAALQERAALSIYRSIGEAIDYGVWICAPDGRNTYASDSFLKMVGITQEQCSNFGWGNVLHPDDAERTITAWQECVRTSGKWDIEHRFRGTNGRWHPVLARGVPVRNEQGEIICWAGINLDISRIKQAEEQIRTSLAENEVLLREVHHRVKNNLAAIMGLLDLQGQKMDDATTKAALLELNVRIKSMALVHEQLYKADNFSRIDFQDYIQALTAHLYLSYKRSVGIRVSVAAKGVVMNLDNAVPCGLLMTELVTNAFKYAFPKGRPRPGADICEITVSADWDGAAYTLTVADNGVGLPVDMDWTNTDTMGLLLVKMFGQHQLQGRIELDRSRGTSFRLRFEPKDK
ncbi:MAG: PAS domain-containing protein [Pseudomonadota bacterium]